MSSTTHPPGSNQRRIIWFALTALSVAAIVALAVAAIWGVGKIINLLSPVLWPLAIAVVLSYLFDPAVSWLAQHKIPRTWGIVIVFFVVLAVVGGLLASVIPQMTKEFNALVNKIPTYTTEAQQRFSEWARRAENEAVKASQQTQSTNAPAATNAPPAKPKSHDSKSRASDNSQTNAPPPELSPNVHQIHNQLVESATDWTGKLLSKFGAWLLAQAAKATALIDVVVAIILIPVYTFYFLQEKRWIKAHWTNYLPLRNSRVKEEIIFILSAINQYMIAFFRGQVLVSICSGILYTIGFLSLGLDYAFLLGFFCMAMTMIPFLGPLISCIISVMLTALQFGDWFHPLMTFALFAVVVGLENFVYSPRIMGNRVGMHPAVVIVAVMIGITLLGGVLGGVLAIPLAAALRVMLFRYLWKPNAQEDSKSAA